MFLGIFLMNVSAVEDDHNLSGVVLTANGQTPLVQTEFCIHVEYPAGFNIWTRYPDTGWVMTEQGVDGQWWYSYVLPNKDYQSAKWGDGAIYMVQVNGGYWGEYNGNTTSNGTGSAGDPFPTPYDPQNPDNMNNTINYSPGGGTANEQQWDVRTVAFMDLAPIDITGGGLRPVDYPFGIPVPPGTLIQINFNVTNYGSSASGNFSVDLYECNAAGQNTGPSFAHFDVPSIPPGGISIIPSTDWTSPLSSGDYYINISVDSDRDVAEFDEVNNIFILHFKIGPDIIPTNVLIDGLSPTDPIYIGPGMDIQITANAMNVGNSPTGSSFIMTLYNITGPSGPKVPGDQAFNYTISELDVLELSPLQTWTWPSPWVAGDHYVNITVDYANVTSEADERNNNYTLHFNVPVTPVTRIFSLDPTFIYQDEWYVNETTELYFTVSGFNPPYSTYYRITDLSTTTIVKDWSNFTEEGTNFIMSYGEGAYEIEFNSTDSVGAEEETNSQNVIVDNSVPITSIDVGIPKYRGVPSGFWNITSATNISLSALDYPLGVNALSLNRSSGINAPGVPESGIFYRIEDLGTGSDVLALQEYTPDDEFFLDDPAWTDGYYRIWFNSTDNLEQKETNYLDVYLDNTGPSSDIDWDNAPDTNVDFSTRFTLSADDGQGSGIDYIEYRISIDAVNWTSWQTYTGSFNLTLAIHGSWDHTIEFQAIDNLGTLGSTGSQDIYIEGDITPPLPPVLRLRKNQDNIELYWEPSSDLDVDYYLIYRSAEKWEFNFSSPWVDTSQDASPLRTSWNDTTSDTSSELFYAIRGVDTRSNIGYTSNLAGKHTLTFEKGYNTFALPLETFENTSAIRATDMLYNDIFADEKDTLFRYNEDIQQWIGHPKFLPSEIDDFTLEMGESYMIFIKEGVIEYTFLGSPATAVRFKEGIGDKPEFLEGLNVTVEGTDVQLSWEPATGAQGYEIYRAGKRMGQGSLTDYSIQPIGNVSAGTTTWQDPAPISPGGIRIYMVVVVDGAGERYAGTYAVGVNSHEFTQGYRSFSFELEPKASETIDSFAREKFTSDSDCIYYYNAHAGQWIGHPKFLPENINTGNVVTGEGYMIFIDAETTTISLVGV